MFKCSAERSNRFRSGFAVDLQTVRFLERFIKVAGGFCTIRFVDRGGGIKVRESRLYPSKEAAEASLQKKETSKKSHWEY